MTTTQPVDRRVFGQRLRHYRRQAGMTLRDLGEAIGRPAPWLSQVENGHIEPKLSTIGELAGALDTGVAELLDNRPPSRRAELEIALEERQSAPADRDLALPYIKATSKLSDEVLEHIVGLYGALDASHAELLAAQAAATTPARRANNELRDMMRRRDNYFGEIEAVATELLDAVGYNGFGPISERTLLDIAEHYGFSITRVQDLPRSSRSITDLERRVVYIPQRNELPTRAARSVVLSTLGHFALEHRDPADIDDYLRQRVESNYFAGAVLAPERAAVEFLADAKAEGDISVEDLKEVFYISYEMAAHRLTNLATRHLEVPVHFLRTDEEGVVRKAYENNGLPLPVEPDGTLEGQRVPLTWGPRQAFVSEDTFALHYQYTETTRGTYWCVTHVEADRAPHHAVTVGTTELDARHFRGSDTPRRLRSEGDDGESSRMRQGELEERWENACWPSARDRQFVVAGMPTGSGGFGRFPGVEMDEVYAFLDRR